MFWSCAEACAGENGYLRFYEYWATIKKVSSLANVLQVAFDVGAKKVLLPMSSAADISTVPSELFAKFQISFYEDPIDAVYKALGVE